MTKLVLQFEHPVLPFSKVWEEFTFKGLRSRLLWVDIYQFYFRLPFVEKESNDVIYIERSHFIDMCKSQNINWSDTITMEAEWEILLTLSGNNLWYYCSHGWSCWLFMPQQSAPNLSVSQSSYDYCFIDWKVYRCSETNSPLQLNDESARRFYYYISVSEWNEVEVKVQN